MDQDPSHNRDLTHRIIGLAMRVHRRLGPGLLESVYERCLSHELNKEGIAFQRQVPLPVPYDDILLDCGYIADVIVDGQVILELKAVERTQPLHEAQLDLSPPQPMPRRPADQFQHGVVDRRH